MLQLQNLYEQLGKFNQHLEDSSSPQLSSLNQNSLIESIEQIQFPQYESDNIPCLINGLDLNTSIQSYEYLLKQFPNCSLKLGEDGDGNRVEMDLKQFVEYSRKNTDVNPLYIFESDLEKLSEDGRHLYELYDVPQIFQQDLFSNLGQHRPQYRWVLLGPQRSGSLCHIDPYMTSAWNISLMGRKRWIIMEPSCSKDIVTGKRFVNEGQIEAIRIKTPLWYFQYAVPQIRDRLEKDGLKYYECIQGPGQTMFVPRGWWHAVVNLDDTLALTQNFASPTNFEDIWKALRIENPQMRVRLFKNLPKQFQLKAQEIDSRDEYISPLDGQSGDQSENEDDLLEQFDNSKFQEENLVWND